jgi:anti-sigma B factor antagonist
LQHLQGSTRCPRGGPKAEAFPFASNLEPEVAGAADTRQDSSPVDFTIDMRQDAHHVVIVIGGELDIASAPRLQAKIDEAERSGASEVVVDLGAVSFIDSSGVNVLVQLHRRARAGAQELLILPGPPQVQRVFRLTGLTAALPFGP